MNSNHLPANSDLARGLERVQGLEQVQELVRVQELERVLGLVLELEGLEEDEGSKALAEAQEAK